MAANDIMLNYHCIRTQRLPEEIMLRILTLVISPHPHPPTPHSNPALWSLSFSWNVWKYLESSTRISGWAHFQTLGSTLYLLQSVPDVFTPSIFVNNAGSMVQTHPHPHHHKVYTSSHCVSYSFSYHVSIHHQQDRCFVVVVLVVVYSCAVNALPAINGEIWVFFFGGGGKMMLISEGNKSG